MKNISKKLFFGFAFSLAMGAILFATYSSSYFLASTVEWPSTPQGEVTGGKITNLLYPDLQNYRLGIGTTNPQGKMDVYGISKRISLGQASEDGTGGNGCLSGKEKVYFDTTGVLAGYEIDGKTIETVTPTYVCTSTNNFGWSAGAEKWWYDPDSLVTVSSTGQLGIGVSSPTAPLDVVGGAKISGGLNMNSGKISNLGEPTEVGDAATVTYVTNRIGSIAWKEPVDDNNVNDGYGSYGACDSSKEGMAAYNKSNSSIYICNSSKWVVLKHVNTSHTTISGSTDEPLTGTVSVGAGSTTVTGSGTSFTTELSVGDTIMIDGQVFTITNIASDTQLTIDSPHTTGATNVTAYTDSPNLLVIQNGDQVTLVTINNDGDIYTVGGATIQGDTVLNGETTVNNTFTVNGSPDPISGTVTINEGSTTVTGSGTSFTTELTEGDTISIGGEIYTIVEIVDNDTLIVDHAAPETVTNVTAYQYSNLFVVNDGDTYINNTLNVTGGLDDPLSGTVTINQGSTTVTGNGTNFTTEITEGDAIMIGDQIFTVVEVVSDTQLIVDTPATTTVSNVIAYTDDYLMIVNNGDNVTYFSVSNEGNTTINGELTVNDITNLNNTVNVSGATDTPLSGTVSVANNSTTVNGSGTSFTTELSVGDAIMIGGQVFTITNIASDTQLTIDSPHVGGATNVTAYTDATNLFVIYNGDQQTLVMINNDGDIYTVGDITAEGDIISNTLIGSPLYCDENGDNCKTILELSNSSQWTDVTGGINYAGGNVGIGTALPTQKLEVTGNLKLNGDLITDRWLGSNTNTAVGIGAFGAGTIAHTTGWTGWRNTAVGNDALNKITSGGENTAVGFGAMINSTTANASVAVGSYAMRDNTTGYKNTAVGMGALAENTTGFDNVAMGWLTLGNNSTGNANTGIGVSSLFENTTGKGNTALGFYSLENNTTASNNTAIGQYALSSNTTASMNTAVGHQALESNLTGIENTAIGAQALDANSTGEYNTAIGFSALRYNTIGNQNTALGKGSFNTFTDDTAKAKTFLPANVDVATDQITVTAHGFGANQQLVFLKTTTTGTLPAGFDAAGSVILFRVVDANTLVTISRDITSQGSGTHTLTPAVQYSNSTAVGHDAEPTASNQVVLGNEHVTEVITAGKFKSAATLETDTDDTVTTKGYVDALVNPTCPPPMQLTGTITVNAGTKNVVGVGTQFLTELDVFMPFDVEGGETLIVQSIADNTHLTLLSNSMATYSNANIYELAGNCNNGSSSNSSAIYESGMTSSSETLLTGTISMTSGTVNVTGTGTQFLTELEVGDFIMSADEILQVASITDNTHLVVETPSSSDLSNEAFYLAEILLGTNTKVLGDLTVTENINGDQYCDENGQNCVAQTALRSTLGGLTCSNGQIAKWNGTAWACAADASGSGGDDWGAQTVSINTTLSGNGTSGSPLGVNTTNIQSRVSGTCAAGSSIRVINSNGTVTCETDDSGSGTSEWTLTSGTLSPTNPSTTNVSIGNDAFLYSYATGTTTIDNLMTGSLRFEQDSGIVSWIDMPVSNTPANGTVQSYTAQIDSQPILTVYAQANGSGGIVSTSKRVGINNTAPSQALTVNGNITYTGSSTQSSDRRYKKNIIPLQSALDTILQLQGVSYEFRTEDFPEMNFETDTRNGLIAQEVEKVLPDVVSTNDDGYKSIDYVELVPFLIEAIKEQQTQIDRQAEQIATLEALVEQK